ncbi:biotin/lipoyl-binding protein [bacterium]|nr:biotin/lipoyl-binding protein [bacterium]
MIKNFFRILIFLIILGLGVAGFLRLVKTRQSPTRVKNKEMAVSAKTVKTSKMGIFPTVNSYGAVKHGKKWTAVAEVGGSVIMKSENLKEGAVVKKGDILLKIDPVDYELAVSGINTELQITDSQLQEIYTTRKLLKETMAIEKKNLDLAQKDLKRQELLFKKKAVADVSKDRSSRSYYSQKQKYISVKSQYDILPAKIKQLKSKVKGLNVKLKQANRQLERTVITAPFDSVVGLVNIEKDQFIRGGSSMFQLSGIDYVEVYCEISTSDMNILMSGCDFTTSALVWSDKYIENLDIEVTIHQLSGALGNVRIGTLKRIKAELDAQTRNLTMIIEVKDPYKKGFCKKESPIFPGDLVKVKFKSLKKIQAFVLPRISVVEKRVKVISDEGRMAFRKVEMFYNSGEFSIVQSGLKSGEQVIISEVIPEVEGVLINPEPDLNWQKKVTALGE